MSSVPTFSHDAALARDVSAPVVRLMGADGTLLGLGDRLLSFSLEDSASRIDQVTLQLRNDDLQLFDDGRLMPGAELVVVFGYLSHSTQSRALDVRRVSGFERLTVQAHGRISRMAQTPRTRAFENVTLADVVREVAMPYGFQSDRLQLQGADIRIGRLHQAGETDAHFLARLARAYGLYFRADADGLFFGAHDLASPPARVFHWRLAGRGAGQGSPQGEVLSVSVESDLHQPARRVRRVRKNPETKEVETALADNTGTERDTLAAHAPWDSGTADAGDAQAAEAAGEELVVDVGADGAKDETEARFRTRAAGAMRLQLTVIGDPSLRPGQVISLLGAGSLLSGKYELVTVAHDIGTSGYLCRLSLRRAGTGRSERDAPKQAGRLNPHPDEARSEVQVIETVDPETGRTELAYRMPRSTVQEP